MLYSTPKKTKVRERAGNLYGPLSAPGANATTTAGTIHYYPVVLDGCSFANLKQFQPQGAWTSNVRMALFADAGGIPGSLITESTDQVLALSNTHPLNMTLSGVFWMAVRFSALTANSSFATYEYLGVNASRLPITHYTEAGAYGAFPATAGTLIAATTAAGAFMALEAA